MTDIELSGAKIGMYLGIVAAAGAALVGWQQLGGPIPATHGYVQMVESDLADSIAVIRDFGVDTRILVLGQQLAETRREMVDLEHKMKTDRPSPAMVRLSSQLREQESRLERQIRGLERQTSRNP